MVSDTYTSWRRILGCGFWHLYSLVMCLEVWVLLFIFFVESCEFIFVIYSLRLWDAHSGMVSVTYCLSDSVTFSGVICILKWIFFCVYFFFIVLQKNV